MTKAKLILFVVALIIFSVFIAFFLVPKTAPPSTGKVLAPKINNRIDATYVVESGLDKDGVLIPESLNVYSLDTTPLPIDQITKIAASLGFSSDPFVQPDAEIGQIYIWADENKRLWVSPSLHTIDYTFVPTSTINASFSTKDELAIIAKRFIEEKMLIPFNNLELYKFEYLIVNNEGTEPAALNNADVANLLFRQNVDGYPIINSTDLSTISVVIERDDTVSSVRIEQSNIRSLQGKYQIKTFEELVATIPQAKIQNLDISLSPVIGKTVVEKASIVYLKEFNRNQSLLQPVFLLEGRTQLTSGGEVATQLFLPALSEKNLLK